MNPLKSKGVEEPSVYFTIAGDIKRRKLTPLQSKAVQRSMFEKGLIGTDARRKGFVCLAVARGNKRTRLDACEPKADGSRRMLRSGADTADGASAWTIALNP